MSEKDGELDLFRLCSDTIDKVDHYRSKNTTTDVEVYTVVKTFFSAYFEIEKEYSIHELQDKINTTYFDEGVRENLLQIIHKLEVVEYEDSPYQEKELDSILSEFRSILVTLRDEEKDDSGFFSNLFSWFSSDKDEKSEERSVSVETKSISQDTEEESEDEKDMSDVEIPNSNNTKKEMKDYLDVRGVEYDEDMLKDEIYELVKEEKKKHKRMNKLKDKQKSEGSGQKESFKKRLEKAHEIKDEDKLQTIYDSLLEEYERFSDEKKSKYYDDIEALYERLA